MTLTTITPNSLPIEGLRYPPKLHQRLGKGAPPLTIQGPTDWLNGTDHPVIALFSSVKAPARAILQAHELAQQWRTQPITIISGFQSPLEEEVWSVLIQDMATPFSPPPKQNGPRLVKVLARGMVQRFSAREHHFMVTETLVLVSPFNQKVKRPTREMALFRNRVAAALADSILVAHTEARSSTAQLAEMVQKWNVPMLSL